MIGRAGIGIDNIDVEAATERGIVVMNTPESGAVTTAELAISLLLSMARNIPAADASMKQGRWEKTKLTGYLPQFINVFFHTIANVHQGIYALLFGFIHGMF